ncbi:DEAD/DEAH box helicase [Kribbella yunnanensis]|uniref:DEAD/DEAH box helicase n=1 Tax=Kribbella yunnanensis TaxID=190194 RepID=A0ABN2IKG6_9ACTN
MAERLPTWLRDALRRKAVSTDDIAELRAMLGAGLLTISQLRLLLLQPMRGVAGFRKDVLAWLVGRPETATSILAQHTQIARLPPIIHARRARATDPRQFESQASLRTAEGTQTGNWRSATTQKGADHLANLDLLRALCPRDQARTGPRSVVKAVAVKPSALPPLRRTAETPATYPAADLLELGWELLFDADACPSRPQMLLCPPRSSRPDVRGQRVMRTVRWPDEVREVECLVLDMPHAISLLMTAGAWSNSALLWHEVTIETIRWIENGRILPTICDAHRPQDRRTAWRIGPLTQSTTESFRRWTAKLNELPHCAATFSRSPEPLTIEHAREYVDAVAATFVPDTALWWMIGDQPFVSSRSDDAGADLQDWVDQLEARLEAAPGFRPVLRINAPDPNLEVNTVKVDLLLATGSSDPETAPPAAQVWLADSIEPRLRLRLRRLLRQAGRLLPTLSALGLQYRPESLLVGVDALPGLRAEVGEALRDLGIDIHWPRNWATDLAASVVVGNGPYLDEPDGSLGLPQLLDRRWWLTLDGELLSEQEMMLLAEASMPIVWLRQRWVLIDLPIRQKLEHRDLAPVSSSKGKMDALLQTVFIDGQEYACSATEGLAHLLDELRDSDSSEAESNNFRIGSIRLHQHQREAIAWLEGRSRAGLNTLLADDMGLGKTFTALGFHLSDRRAHRDAPTLVLCTSRDLVRQWRDAAARCLGDTPPIVHAGPRRALPSLSGGSLVITTYDTLAMDIEILAPRRWGLVIADEAQRIKNPWSRAARAIRRLDAPGRLAISGTPLENHPRETWAILDWLNCGMFETRQGFERRLVAPLRRADRPRTEALRTQTQQMLHPVVLRRTKNDPALARQLPPRLSFTHELDLSDVQRSLLEMLARDTERASSLRQPSRRSGEAALRLMDAMKQVCSSPALYRRDDPADVRSNPERAAIDAPKLDRMHKILADAAQHGESTVIFANYIGTADLIHAYLTGVGISSARYHGKIPPAQKAAALRELAEGHIAVLIPTLKSGGTGLDLPRASRVIHYERWWTPAQENQGSDRVHRFGQQRPVQVHVLKHANGIEDHIAALHARKERYADHFLPSTNNAPPAITARELAQLFQLDAR